MPHQPEVGV